MFLLIFLSILAIGGSTPVDKKAGLQIVGGTPYSIATVPYQAGLEYGIYSTKSLICGAAIISNYYLLTAAHCRVSTVRSYFRIRVGTSTKGFGGTLYNLILFVNHPYYNPTTYANDIAYIRTTAAITFTTNVKAAIMMPSGTFSTTAKLLVTGWGTTSSGGSMSSTLLGAIIDYVPDNICKSKYGSTNILSGMICAAAPGKDSCQGDSGGPMVFEGNKTLVGIVSWGYGCADPYYPGVYTSVSSYRTWLKNTIGL